MIRDDELTVVCTDRGAHKPRTLARLSVKVQYGRVVIGRVGRTRRYRTDDGRAITPRSAPGTDDARRREDDDGLTFTFTCPSCGRNLPLRDDRLAKVADTDGRRPRWRVSSLDISHLHT